MKLSLAATLRHAVLIFLIGLSLFPIYFILVIAIGLLARRAIADKRDAVILNIGATYSWTGGPGTAHSAAASDTVSACCRPSVRGATPQKMNETTIMTPAAIAPASQVTLTLVKTTLGAVSSLVRAMVEVVTARVTAVAHSSAAAT